MAWWVARLGRPRVVERNSVTNSRIRPSHIHFSNSNPRDSMRPLRRRRTWPPHFTTRIVALRLLIGLAFRVAAIVPLRSATASATVEPLPQLGQPGTHEMNTPCSSCLTVTSYSIGPPLSRKSRRPTPSVLGRADWPHFYPLPAPGGNHQGRGGAGGPNNGPSNAPRFDFDKARGKLAGRCPTRWCRLPAWGSGHLALAAEVSEWIITWGWNITWSPTAGHWGAVVMYGAPIRETR